MRLSILICHLNRREASMGRLMDTLRPQLGDDAEIVVEADDGEKTIGAKRNSLLRAAVGDYVAFVDDDDMVSGDYVSRIIAATEVSPDCVGITGTLTRAGLRPQTFVHSLRFRSAYESKGVYYRPPNHLTPVRREFALSALFPEISYGEAAQYTQNLLPLLSTEAFIDSPLYFYLFGMPFGGRPQQPPGSYYQSSRGYESRCTVRREEPVEPFYQRRGQSDDDYYVECKQRAADTQQHDLERLGIEAHLRVLVTDTMRLAATEIASGTTPRTWPDKAAAAWPRGFLEAVAAAVSERHGLALIQSRCDEAVWYNLVVACLRDSAKTQLLEADVERLARLV